ncbi:MAG TPA: tripartite tricarboxylate transporter TctB family protein [Ideonella sp.]|nr:tripartite tricarboxylate transporter TctB family protein [Ideonella sp.]
MVAKKPEVLIGVGVLALAAVLAFGATSISSDAGYGGVGPNFVPWVVAGVLGLCGGFLLWESLSGGFRQMEEPSGAEHGYWPGFAWVTAGMLLNAALITTLGFIFSCTLCFTLAVRGYKASQGHPDYRPAAFARDALIGLAIAAPVYWMFTKLLAINLPGLTATGWL